MSRQQKQAYRKSLSLCDLVRITYTNFHNNKCEVIGKFLGENRRTNELFINDESSPIMVSIPIDGIIKSEILEKTKSDNERGP